MYVTRVRACGSLSWVQVEVLYTARTISISLARGTRGTRGTQHTARHTAHGTRHVCTQHAAHAVHAAHGTVQRTCSCQTCARVL